MTTPRQPFISFVSAGVARPEELAAKDKPIPLLVNTENVKLRFEDDDDDDGKFDAKKNGGSAEKSKRGNTSRPREEESLVKEDDAKRTKRETSSSSPSSSSTETVRLVRLRLREGDTLHDALIKLGEKERCSPESLTIIGGFGSMEKCELQSSNDGTPSTKLKSSDERTLTVMSVGGDLKRGIRMMILTADDGGQPLLVGGILREKKQRVADAEMVVCIASETTTARTTT